MRVLAWHNGDGTYSTAIIIRELVVEKCGLRSWDEACGVAMRLWNTTPKLALGGRPKECRIANSNKEV